MSHSSLSAQLASLHSKNGVSSRQHSDAVGRGIHHSSNAGHTILNNSVKHKPSVLYPDSKAAAIADVPFTTLRENAVASLQFLSQHSSPLFDANGQHLPWKKLFGPKSIKYERGINSKDTNAKFDGLLKDALHLLSTAWGDSINTMSASSSSFIQLGANKPSSVLHALEYLVQKYYVHVHNAETLLVSFLPHHETFLFDRILQLVDLSQYPHWSFLRPFSAARGLSGVPRTVIAKWAASTKDNGGGIVIVQRICEVAKRAAKIHSQERKLGLNREEEVRRGISICISFAAATMAETFHIQRSATGSIDESLLRTIIPVVFNALEPLNGKHKSGKSKMNWSVGALCPEWRSFGRIMISLLVDNCELSEELNFTLANAIVRGCVESIQLARFDELELDGKGVDVTSKIADYDLDDMSSSSKQSILEIASDAILTIMTISQSLSHTLKGKEENNVRSSLSVVTSNRKLHSNQCIGYNVSMRIFRIIMKIPFLASAIGHVSNEKDIDVRSLLATIFAMSISDTGSKQKEYQKHSNLALDLATESSLQTVLREKETNLVASITSFIVEYAANLKSTDPEIKETIQMALSKILQSMKVIDSSSCDIGITRAVTLISSMSTDKEDKGKKVQELLQLSGHLNKAITGEAIKKEHSNTDGKIVLSGDNQFDHLLPPMMALEHPNEILRMQAITKLEEGVSDESNAYDIATALLRRYISDDEARVATRSIDALQSLHSKGRLADSFFIQPQVTEDIVFGLNKWTVRSDQEMIKDDLHTQCLCASLSIAALTAQVITKNSSEHQMIEDVNQVEKTVDDSVTVLVQNIAAHVSRVRKGEDKETNDPIAEKALESLLNAIGEDSSKAQERNEAVTTICENTCFQNIVTACIDDHKDLENEKFLLFFIEAWNEIMDCHKGSKHAELLVVTVAKILVATYEANSQIEITSSDSIRLCLEKYVPHQSTESTIQLVTKLSSVPSNIAFKQISTPVIKKVVGHLRKGSSLNPSLFVLLEAISRPTINVIGVERLLCLIDELISLAKKVDSQSCCEVLMTMLSLCGHSELGIRKRALNLINNMDKTVPKKDSKWKAIILSCSSNTSTQTNVLMDGANALPQLLVNMAKSSDGASSITEFLVNSCNSMARKGLKLINESDSHCGDGFCNSTSVLLSAMETAGEKIFPLSTRWKKAGKPIFDFFMNKWPRTEPLSQSAKTLLECVVLMIKGVTIEPDNINQGIVITSQVTGSGRRSRSYSVGMSEGISYIHPYPSDMTKAVIDFLAAATSEEMGSYLLEFCDIMISLVMRRTSWVNGVFMKTDKSIRKDIAISLLNLRSHKNVEAAGLVIMGLKLNATELLHLMTSDKSKGSNTDSVGLLALTVITECICQQTHDFINDAKVPELISILFERLLSLSNKNGLDSNDSCDYTRCCIVQSLLSLTETLKSGENELKNLSQHAKLLVALLRDTNDSGDIKPLLSSKSRTLALELLTNLCALSPATIVGSLVPAMISTMTTATDLANFNASETAMAVIIPTYCKHASSAGLSLMDLLNAFMEHCGVQKGTSWNQMLQLYTSLIKGLSSYAESNNSLAMATILTVFLASEASEKTKQRNKEDTEMDVDETPITFTSKLLQEIGVHDRIGCSLQMLHYIGKMLATMTSENNEQDDDASNKTNGFFLVSSNKICSLAQRNEQDSDTTQKKSMPLMWLIVTMLDVLQENIYSLPLVKRSIRISDDRQAGVCLKVWQELSSLQSLLAYYKYQETSRSQDTNNIRTKFWTTSGFKIGDILSTVQRTLPTPHFLASVSSLVSDSTSNVDIQKRAIQLLAERSAEVDTASAEATLFLEMVPDLVNIAKAKKSKKKKNSSNNNNILQQTSFGAIDHLAKNLGLGDIDEKTRRSRSAVFLPAFQTVAIFLRHENDSLDLNGVSDDNMDESQTSLFMESQVLSSAALCAATLITMLKARCVAQLQTLVKSVLSILSAVNNCLRHNTNIQIGGTNHQSLKLIQISTIRTLVAVAESIPQFLAPFIEALLAPTCLPSINIRQDSSDEGIAVNAIAERLENAIATRSPVHQLIPTLSKATKKCFSNTNNGDCWREALSILKILKVSISQSSRSDLNPLAGKILNALVQAYGHNLKEGRVQLLKEANETLLSLVMKLSESQLRPLYARLREWRGELDTTSVNGNLTCRRFAFWSLSAAICQKLRNIFLPCMSSVVGDMIKELDYTVSCLCTSSANANGNKRQKTQDNFSFDVGSLSPLQPLLLCLESTLKADAHEGGNWIRSEDGQRYRMLLDRLGKLLQATVPSDFSIISDEDDRRKSASAYEMLIEGVGTEEQGNVSQTLTALAAAAGNEQLWKPLNYSLLEACGNNRRSEVRKTGVKSLLRIIQTLGEEYMVLLPECLPVLSELLEDEDETIITLAKECVHQGEELLGESLEDSLR